MKNLLIITAALVTFTTAVKAENVKFGFHSSLDQVHVLSQASTETPQRGLNLGFRSQHKTNSDKITVSSKQLVNTQKVNEKKTIKVSNGFSLGFHS